MTIRELIQKSTEHLLRIITQPRSELTRWQRAARFTYDLGRTGAQQLRRDRASQMAAALAYRTLFSLLPILAVGTALVRAFSGQEQFLSLLEDGMRAANFESIMMASRDSAETTTLIEWLLPLAEHAASRNLAAVGWVGLCVLIYAALSFVVTIENSFNSICQAVEGRSWVRRVPMYWFVL
ncbi:MAG: YihY/virulence factor BrkB family protein, partial [Phycisphaerales bacterium]|nr:YihY/virulence factor BrkB family protein [Phycisphaerales bacterium]